jgi:hypothetical protein
VIEEWKDIPGDPDREISSFGRVRRTRATTNGAAGSIIEGSVNANGYRVVWAKLHGKRGRLCQINRIVLEAFVGPPGPGQLALHNDGNSLNDCLSNLRWGSFKDNMGDRDAHGTTARGSRNGKAKLTEEQVSYARRSYTGAYGEVSALARELGVDRSVMCRVLSGAAWKQEAGATP